MDGNATFRTGSDRNRSYGDCLYRGKPQPLPLPRAGQSVLQDAEAMYTDGYVQFPDLLSEPEMHVLRSWMDDLSKSDRDCGANENSPSCQIPMNLQRDSIWLTLIDRTPIFETLELILGKKFICIGGSCNITNTASATPLHVDRLSITLPEEVARDPRVRIPIFTVTVNFYLDDQTEEISPTLLIPGSHRSGRVPNNESTWNGIEPKRVALKAGGALLFRHDLWHGTGGGFGGGLGTGSGEGSRHLIQIHYGERSWKTAGPPITRPEYFSQEVLSRATPRQRVLMGEASNGIFL